MSAAEAAAVFPKAQQFDAINENLAMFRGAMDTQNAILSRIADKLGAVQSPHTWAEFQTLVRAGSINTVARVGDQVEVSMNPVIGAEVSGSGVTAANVDKDVFTATVGIDSHTHEFVYDGAAWNYRDSAAELADYGITVTGTPASGDTVIVHITVNTVDFDVQGIDEDAPVGADLIHSVSLLMHNCLYNMVFDPAQYLYYVDAAAWPDGLPAGTYNITLDHGAYNGATTQDGTYQFTITRPVPVGGGIRHTTIGANWSDGFCTKENLLAGTFMTYAANRVTTIESGLATAEGAEGTNLGTTTNRDPQYKAGDYINFSQRQASGSGRWSTSWLRQVLNSNDAEVQFVPATPWSRPSGSKTEGFLHSLDPALVKVLGKTRKRYALSIADGYGYEDVEDIVGLNTMTDMGLGNNNAIAEGAVDAAGALIRAGAYALWDGTISVDWIKYLNGAGRIWWLGSACPTSAHDARALNNLGVPSDSGAGNTYGIVPRLTII